VAECRKTGDDREVFLQSSSKPRSDKRSHSARLLAGPGRSTDVAAQGCPTCERETTEAFRHYYYYYYYCQATATGSRDLRLQQRRRAGKKQYIGLYSLEVLSERS